MAEETLDLRALDKTAAWEILEPRLQSVLAGCRDEIAAMATMSCLVHHAFGNLWTGFYRVVGPQLLRVGPYQGTLGCLEIPFARGVCGRAARENRTVIVDDVHADADHIACDGRSRSEIVVPVRDAAGAVVAVFDVDSEHVAAFDARDAAALERVLATLHR